MRTVTEQERRSRLGVRHALLERAPTALAAADAVVCLHATELTSVYLSAFARSGANRAEIDRALYRDRTLVRQLAMRRTVFAFPRELLPAVLGSAAARVAGQQRALLARAVTADGLDADGVAWVERVCAATFALVREGPATTAQLRERLPALAQRLPAPERGPGAAPTPVASRVLTALAADGSVVRGRNDGGWAVSRPYWTSADDWLGHPVDPLSDAAGYAELVRRWLWAFGPGTEADLTWWLGATKTAVRKALVDIEAVPVQLEDGSPAWLHPEDPDQVDSGSPWGALLPTLDPTTMGWRGRNFFLDPAIAPAVYDAAGNGRPTAWWNGRVVGTWTQRSDGSVAVLPAVTLTRQAAATLRHHADELTGWLDGHVIRSSLQRPSAPALPERSAQVATEPLDMRADLGEPR